MLSRALCIAGAAAINRAFASRKKLAIKVYRTKANGSQYFLNSDIDPANSGLSDNKYVENDPTANVRAQRSASTRHKKDALPDSDVRALLSVELSARDGWGQAYPDVFKKLKEAARAKLKRAKKGAPQ